MNDRRWEVEPGAGVGPLRFGMARAELRALLGPSSGFRRGGYSEHLTDQPANGSALVTCSPEEGLYLIEIPDPDGVTYRGVPLAGPAAEVMAALRGIGVDLVEDSSGCTFAEHSIALYVPSSEPDAPVEAVSAFGPGRVMDVNDLNEFPAGERASAPGRVYQVVSGVGVGPVRLGEPRADVRRKLNGGMSWTLPPGSREPEEDHFWEDGLVVEYGPDGLVRRIFVTKADRVDYHGVDLKPPYPAVLDDVRQALLAGGHTVVDGEALLDLPGTGVQVWISRADAEMPLPVCAVVVSAIPD
ncbi:hypothetical protein [Catellatospora sichuanensis]|uniref:hypothetical protein n=1 Tax=Catellatospora sichuanensis TaxID=1969805 RepID=UPI001182FC5E|nr:hypothetical protein [Catellatospora sichuanensis]